MTGTPQTETRLRRSGRKSQAKPEMDVEVEELEASGKKRRSAKKSHTEMPAKKKKGSAQVTLKEEGEESLNDSCSQENRENEEESGQEEQQTLEEKSGPKKRKGVAARASSRKADDEEGNESFRGDPVPANEARERWPHRYLEKGSLKQKESDDQVQARCHYLQAEVDGCIYNLNDGAYVKAGEGEADYIGRVVEFFETTDQQLYFTAQWFFRAEDTVIKEHAHHHDPRRVFLSDERNDNALNCLVKKIRIVRVTPKIGMPVKEKDIRGSDLYYDMSFSVAYSSFASLPSDVGLDGSETASTTTECTGSEELCQSSELSLLDLYSGCGAMSTGLCIGANLSGVNLKTRWAVDINNYACESLKHNHPETEVRNEKAEDFLAVLREWNTLCKKYCLEKGGSLSSKLDSSDDEEETDEPSKVQSEEFEVGKLVGICYGKTENIDEDGLKFKVRWKGYGPSEDTWEPADGLRNCEERIRDFVIRGFKNNILPLPGSVDVICGGPPCQGMSGFNRFRESKDPFKDEKNKQMAVYMDIIEFLKPKFVLMENVVDILKFAKGFLGRYALSRLVSLRYQARLGILAAGNYGLPQYRMRVFLWGAQPTEKLPQLPLPTHDVVVRGAPPVEFETHVVAFDGSHQRKLEKALLLADAISDLPPVENDETRDEMSYNGPPKTDFQRYIRLSREEMIDPSSIEKKPHQTRKLFDHRSLQLNNDDYQRVCQIPKHKGANFRDLPGVVVGANNIVEWAPNIPRVMLPSGKPLVPDYAMTFKNGTSPKPFGRLWWDETVPTVVTRAEPHNQIIIHPQQDRVLSIRENARLQGFPDYYKLFGPVKARYIQVGNAVAVPVSRALGYGFGRACQRKGDGEPAFALPQNFPINLGSQA